VLKLDFYGHFYCQKPVSNGHCKKNDDFFVNILVDRSFLKVCQQTELPQKCNILLFGFVFRELLFLFDFVDLPYCLWKYDISELSIVHENAICLFQVLLILINVDMTLLRRILREPVFSGHPVLSGHQQGPPNTGLTVYH